MLVIWLIVWLCCNTPALHEWNAWAVGLIVCAAAQVLGALARSKS